MAFTEAQLAALRKNLAANKSDADSSTPQKAAQVIKAANPESAVFTPLSEQTDRLERAIQAEVISVLRDLGLLHYHVWNGADVTDLQRMIAVGEGLASGVPDICVPEPFEFNGVLYYGLYIELKRGIKAKVSERQIQWARALRERGYWVISGIGGASLVIDFLVMVFKPRKLPDCMRVSHDD